MQKRKNVGIGFFSCRLLFLFVIVIKRRGKKENKLSAECGVCTQQISDTRKNTEKITKFVDNSETRPLNVAFLI